MKRVFCNEEQLATMIHHKIKKADWLKPVYNRMLEISNILLETTAEEWFAVHPVSGKVFATTARRIGGKIGALYTSWLLTEEKKYLEKAIDILDEAINRDLDFYHSLNQHLAVGDAVLSLSLSYNFLYDYLNEEQKQRCEKTLRSLANWLHTENCAWGLPQSQVTSCNHNSIHYGALGLCGLLLEEEKWLAHGKERIQAFLNHCADKTGFVTEGFSYLNYGHLTAILFCEAYHQLLGEQLYDMPYTINQLLAQTLPTPGKMLKLNDHGVSVENMLTQVYLSNRYKNAAALYTIIEYEKNIGEYFSDWNMNMSGGFVYPFIYIFTDENLVPQKPSECNTALTQIFESGRVMTRTAWDDPMAIHVSVSSGHCFHSGHNHADKGSFTIYGLGEEFLIDVGAKTNEDRAHNIMMINGVGQMFGISEGEILETRDTDESLFVACDTLKSYVYTPKSLLGIARRNILFVKKPFPFLVIRDDMQIEWPDYGEHFFEFMMHTQKGNTVNLSASSVEIIGQNYGNKCKVSFVYPENVEVALNKEDRTNVSYGKQVASSGLFEEVIASCKAYNPFMTTIITFAESGEDFPKVTTTGSPLDLHVVVEKNGEECVVNVERYSMYIC